MLEEHAHAVHCVDQLREARQIDLHVVVDLDPEVLLDRFDQQLGAAEYKCGVDAVGAVGNALSISARYVDPEVPWEADHLRTRVRGEVHENDRVGSRAGEVAEDIIELRRERGSIVGAYHQEGTVTGRCHRTQ